MSKPEPSSCVRNLRSNSKPLERTPITVEVTPEQTITEKMSELILKRNSIVTDIRKLQKQFDNVEIFTKWTKGDLEVRFKRLEALGNSLNENNMELVCKSERTQEIETENDMLDDLVMALKAKATDKIDEIINASKAIRTKVTAVAPKHSIHVPTWNELETFWEGKKQIHVHEGKRSEAHTHNAPQASMPSRQSDSNKRNRNARDFGKTERSYPSHVICGACEGNHSTNQCKTFRSMNLLGRKQAICDKDLGKKGLQKSHSGARDAIRCNDKCKQCEPAKKYHNSLLCPNANANAVMLTQGDNKRKRKHQNDKHQHQKDKRRRTNDEPKSVVNEIGNWTLKAKTNALSRTNEKNNVRDDGKFTVILATLKITIQTRTNIAPNCRSLSDTGATINCVSRQFVEDNALKTIKCQKPILGVTGPEILTRKIKACIHPWFDSTITIEAEFYILSSLDGYYPFHLVHASKQEIEHLVLADPNFDIPAPIDALLGAEIYAQIIGSDIYKHKDGAIMQATSFGHMVIGKFQTKQASNLPVLSITQNKTYEKENECIAKALNKFWEIESVNKDEFKNEYNEEEKAVESLFVRTHFREKSGRFVVTIPVKPGRVLGESRSIALKQFYQLERKFESKPEVKEKYVEFMRNYQALGYMQPASKNYVSL